MEWLVLALLLGLYSIALFMLSGIIMVLFSGKLWCVKLWKLLLFRKNYYLVKLVDYQNHITYTLVQLNHEDQNYIGYHYYHAKVGQLCLLPDGRVSRYCDSSYLYGWAHVDPDLDMQQRLSWPNYVDFDVWFKLSFREKWELRDGDG